MSLHALQGGAAAEEEVIDLGASDVGCKIFSRRQMRDSPVFYPDLERGEASTVLNYYEEKNIYVYMCSYICLHCYKCK